MIDTREERRIERAEYRKRQRHYERNVWKTLGAAMVLYSLLMLIALYCGVGMGTIGAVAIIWVVFSCLELLIIWNMRRNTQHVLKQLAELDLNLDILEDGMNMAETAMLARKNEPHQVEEVKTLEIPK